MDWYQKEYITGTTGSFYDLHTCSWIHSQVVLHKWDIRFLSLAQFISNWSRDPSTKVGAVIANDKRIISTGFNGFPQGMSDNPNLYSNREEKYSRVVHGEVNALIFSREPLDNCTLYTWPFAPCDRCCVQMLQAGITKFVFPAPTEEQKMRWGSSFEKSKNYIQECEAYWTEVDIGR